MTEKLALRPTEFAEAFGCSRSKAYEMIASGEVPSIEIGGLRRVPVEAMKKKIAEQLAHEQRELDAAGRTRVGSKPMR